MGLPGLLSWPNFVIGLVEHDAFGIGDTITTLQGIIAVEVTHSVGKAGRHAVDQPHMGQQRAELSLENKREYWLLSLPDNRHA